MLSAALLVAVAAAPASTPLADVWPYAWKRLPTGEIEYSYDLTTVKAKGGTSDAIAAHGEEKVKEFLKLVLSREGQDVVAREQVFIPLTPEVVKEELKKLD